MTAVLDTIACQTKAVEIDKEIVEKQLQEALLAKQQALSVLHNILAIVGVSSTAEGCLCLFHILVSRLFLQWLFCTH
jgi:hypothetical protein